jgi:diguanylate cyclase (GGDEF)-like protein
MQVKARHWRRWHFSAGVIAPAVLLLLLTALSVTAFVAWTTTGIDQRSLEQQSALAARALEQQINAIPTAQESVTIWDDAVQYARLTPDADWMDNNLGVWMYEFYGYDAVAVVSDQNQPTYTTVGGATPNSSLFADNWSVIEPMITELRQRIAGGALDAYQDGSSSTFPRVVGVKEIGGTPAVVSILPIVSQTGRLPQAPGTEYLHLVIDYLDQNFADTLHRNYLFDGARFAPSALPQGDHVGQPVLDRNGRVATIFEWIPSRPGTAMLNQTLPVLGLGFLIAGTLVFFLLRGLWRSTAQLETQRTEARTQARTDMLTGLPNRLEFETRLAEALRDRGRNRTAVTLLILDLDRFKHVNDTLGHSAGDALIRAVGQRLRELVGPECHIARLGGDEFAVIHHGPVGSNEAVDLANRIVGAMETPFEVSSSEAFVGASIGVATATTDDADQRELARRADIALYDAKASGRNRVSVYARAMDELLQDRHQIEAELRDALKPGADQLSVAFQPLFSGRTGEIAGAEALVRWNHPKLGPISPVRFVPIAEGSGLIEPLGEFVLRTAMHFGARWPGRRIAVNISPVQLRNPHFADHVLDRLVETGMRPSDLELEITEGILLDGKSAAVETIKDLRQAGIRVALDDFGTGYSSLNYLKRYPVDSIKIDRSFVAQLGTSDPSTAIVSAMVTLAHALGIEVTAEGVETQEQMNILKGMGCNVFQGFLLSRPIPEDEVEAAYRRADDRRHGSVQQVA